MQRSTAQNTGRAAKSDIDYLRYDYLVVMIVLNSVVAGLGVLRASYCWPRTLYACAWPTPLFLIGAALGAYGLRNFSQRLASWVLIAGMLLANIAEIWRFPNGPAPYLLALVVIVAATLRSARNAWGVAAIGTGMLVVMAQFLSTDLTLKETQGPLIMLLLTGLVAWSSTRQFYTAVDWALFSVKAAQARTTEAQMHRAEVVRVNKALDDAYQRLERMNQMLILAHRSAEEARLHKTQFANAVSHELRSPINMIIGFSEMMVNTPEVYGPQAWPPGPAPAPGCRRPWRLPDRWPSRPPRQGSFASIRVSCYLPGVARHCPRPVCGPATLRPLTCSTGCKRIAARLIANSVTWVSRPGDTIHGEPRHTQSRPILQLFPPAEKLIRSKFQRARTLGEGPAPFGWMP